MRSKMQGPIRMRLDVTRDRQQIGQKFRARSWLSFACGYLVGSDDAGLERREQNETKKEEKFEQEKQEKKLSKIKVFFFFFLEKEGVG